MAKRFKITPQTVTGDSIEELKRDIKHLTKIKGIMLKNFDKQARGMTFKIIVELIDAKKEKMRLIKNGDILGSDEDKS